MELPGKSKLQDHGTLYHVLTGFLAEHLGLGSRERRGSGDLEDTGENGAPTYDCSLHQRYRVPLMPDAVGIP